MSCTKLQREDKFLAADDGYQLICSSHLWMLNQKKKRNHIQIACVTMTNFLLQARQYIDFVMFKQLTRKKFEATWSP